MHLPQNNFFYVSPYLRVSQWPSWVIFFRVDIEIFFKASQLQIIAFVRRIYFNWFCMTIGFGKTCLPRESPTSFYIKIIKELFKASLKWSPINLCQPPLPLTPSNWFAQSTTPPTGSLGGGEVLKQHISITFFFKFVYHILSPPPKKKRAISPNLSY